jgi:hypothetical protein
MIAFQPVDRVETERMYLIEYTSTSRGANTVSQDVEADHNGLRGNDSRDATGC